jgi:hypothetical protein
LLAKIADGLSMVWASLDERERLLLLWGAAGLLWLVASALSMPRTGDDDTQLQAHPVVLIVRDREGL